MNRKYFQELKKIDQLVGRVDDENDALTVSVVVLPQGTISNVEGHNSLIVFKIIIKYATSIYLPWPDMSNAVKPTFLSEQSFHLVQVDN